MAKGNLSVTMLTKYQEMIEERFKPAIEQAEGLSNKMKSAIRKEVQDEWGITALSREIDELEERVKTLKQQRMDITGDKHSYTDDQPNVEKEVDRRLMERDGILSALFDAKKQAVDRVWLLNASSEMVSILEELKDAVPKLVLQVKEFERKMISHDEGTI